MILTNQQIKAITDKSKTLGFAACGFTPLHHFEQAKQQYLMWLKNNYHGEMTFLEKNIEKRFNPALLQKGFKSAIVVLLNYYQQTNKKQIPQISKYALGKDYHLVMKEKLCALREFIHKEIVPISGRCFVDSAPIYEKKLATDAGLGWIGKHTLLINKQYGSFVFIGELLSDLELPKNTKVEPNHCGDCSLCIDACPTNALQPFFLDASKCISYLTIEKKSTDDTENIKISPWIYGCDICQNVCPWNQKLDPTKIDAFAIKPFLLSAGISEWENLTPQEFKNIFSDSSLFRTGFNQIKQNLQQVLKT